MKPTRILAALLLALAASGSAQAIPLSDLLNGGSITAGDKLFDRWSLIGKGYDSNDGSTFTAANIDVTALNDGGLNPGPGLKFSVLNSQLTVSGNDIYAYRDLYFGFRASVLAPGFGINGNLLKFENGGAVLSWMTDGSNDNGVFIVETLGSGEGLSDLGITDVEFSSLDNVQTSTVDDSVAFAAQSEVWVTKNILVWSVDTTDSAGLYGFEQRFSQTTTVPEPGTLWLLGLSLAGMGLAKARRK